MKEYLRRRKALSEKLKGEALILPSRPIFMRNRDVTHPYRQDSHLFYFTGFPEPESVFLMVNGKSYLFVAPKDPIKELWEGKRWGLSAKDFFQLDDCFENHEFLKKSCELLQNCQKIYYGFHNNTQFDPQFLKLLERLKDNIGRKGHSLPSIVDPEYLLGEMRLFKSPKEIETLKKACHISALAHKEVMRHTKPGVSEQALHGIFLKEIMEKGAAREGYSSIVASGANATCLHYTDNKDVLKSEEWVLIDAGGEYEHYTGDITRCYPINGKFEGLKKELYEALLEIQKNLIAMAKPGESFGFLQKKATEKILDVLRAHKILHGSKEALVQSGALSKYFPHGLGHWLGSDVHDVGSQTGGVYTPLPEQNKARPFEPSMAFTIEPGVYFPKNDEKIPESIRGFGLRIEDDVLITAMGVEVLSKEAPKEVEELEAFIGSA